MENPKDDQANQAKSPDDKSNTIEQMKNHFIYMNLVLAAFIVSTALFLNPDMFLALQIYAALGHFLLSAKIRSLGGDVMKMVQTPKQALSFLGMQLVWPIMLPLIKKK